MNQRENQNFNQTSNSDLHEEETSKLGVKNGFPCPFCKVRCKSYALFMAHLRKCSPSNMNTYRRFFYHIVREGSWSCFSWRPIQAMLPKFFLSKELNSLFPFKRNFWLLYFLPIYKFFCKFRLPTVSGSPFSSVRFFETYSWASFGPVWMQTLYWSKFNSSQQNDHNPTRSERNRPQKNHAILSKKEIWTSGYEQEERK